MRKYLFFLFSVVLSLSLTQDSLAYGPYYDLNFDKVDEARQQLKQLVIDDSTQNTSLKT
jgi:hypothetical protein